jgi:hypothetical protein
MRKIKHLSPLLLWFALIIIFTSCTKQGPALSNNAENQQNPNQQPSLQSIFYNDITIGSSQNYTFSIPAITQAAIDRGFVAAYATYDSDPTEQWHALPIIYSCSLRLEVTAITEGEVVIQNNLGASATMSYRFDVALGQ